MTDQPRTRSIADCLQLVRQNRPIVHNVTNLVVMNFTANALLALGASPIMAHAREELGEIVSISRSVVLNIGTLDSSWILSLREALAHARELGRPVVLDPVGAGASRLRTDTALELLHAGGVSVLRANASEILALGGGRAHSTSGGVDSRDSTDSAREAATHLSRTHRCVVVISGAKDWIVDSRSDRVTPRSTVISNGHERMTQVTGMGCASSAVIGAMLGSQLDYFEAAVAGMAINGIAGELAAERSQGPGSFAPAYLDALANIDRKAVDDRLRHQERSS